MEFNIFDNLPTYQDVEKYTLIHGNVYIDMKFARCLIVLNNDLADDIYLNSINVRLLMIGKNSSITKNLEEHLIKYNFKIYYPGQIVDAGKSVLFQLNKIN